MPAAILLAVAGCAGPTPDGAAATAAAKSSLQAMVSALRTTDLAASTQLQERAWWQFTDAAVTDAEAVATSVESTYTSRQPPAGSLPLYRSTSKGLSDAAELVTEVRVAVRSRDCAEVRRLLPDLERTADDLDAQQAALP